MKKAIITIFVLLIFSYLTVFLLFNSKSFSFDQSFSQKEWIHRGGSPENTLEGMKKVIAENYQGLEIDIHFVENHFIVSHDTPTREVKLTLEDVFKETKDNRLYWWLDFKNLNMSNYKQASLKLKELEKKYDLTGRLYVEGSKYLPTCLFSYQDHKTLFWINPHAKSRLHPLRKVENMAKIGLCNFSGLTVYYKSYISPGKELFKNIPIFIFTVNELPLIEKYKKEDNIQVVLKDLL